MEACNERDKTNCGFAHRSDEEIRRDYRAQQRELKCSGWRVAGPAGTEWSRKDHGCTTDVGLVQTASWASQRVWPRSPHGFRAWTDWRNAASCQSAGNVKSQRAYRVVSQLLFQPALAAIDFGSRWTGGDGRSSFWRTFRRTEA